MEGAVQRELSDSACQLTPSLLARLKAAPTADEAGSCSGTRAGSQPSGHPCVGEQHGSRRPKAKWGGLRRRSERHSEGGGQLETNEALAPLRRVSAEGWVLGSFVQVC